MAETNTKMRYILIASVAAIAVVLFMNTRERVDHRTQLVQSRKAVAALQDRNQANAILLRKREAQIALLESGIERHLTVLEAQKAELLSASNPQKKQKAVERITPETQPLTGVDVPQQALAAKFREQKAQILAQIDGYITAKQWTEAAHEIDTYDIQDLAGELAHVKRRLIEAEIYAEVRKIPAHNVYLNKQLYDRLHELAPDNSEYARKSAYYGELYQRQNPDGSIPGACYNQGFLYGRCILQSLKGRPCRPEETFAIDRECRQQWTTRQGIAIGVRSAS